MNYTFSSKLTKSEFDDFAQTHPQGTFFQSSQWANVKDNWTPIYTGVYHNETLVGASLVLVRKLIFKYTFMYAPRGPLLDFENIELLEFYLEKLKQLTKENSAIAFTIDPYVIREKYSMQKAMKDKVDLDYDDSIIASFESHGFIHTGFSKDMHHTIQPRFQPAIYLDEKGQSIYEDSRGYKNGIKAQKASVKIKRVGIDDLEMFLEVIEKTEEAKNISLRGRGYFEKLINSYQDQSLVSIAYLDLETELNTLEDRHKDMETRLENPKIRDGRRREYESQLKSIEKETVYISEQLKARGPIVNIAGLLALRNENKAELLYAGMDRDFQKYLGSNLNYVDAVNWAKENKCDSLCFGGSSGHFKAGIDRFKATFDPTLDEYIGEFEFENNKVLNYLFKKAQEVRSKINHRE